MDVRAARIVLIAATTANILTVLPTKNLPRERKDGKGMTKGSSTPWDLPGGKLEDNETSQDAMVRELREETGLDLSEIGATLQLGPQYEATTKTDVYVYLIDSEVPPSAGDGITKCEWCTTATAATRGGFALNRALAVGLK